VQAKRAGEKARRWLEKRRNAQASTNPEEADKGTSMVRRSIPMRERKGEEKARR